MTTRRRFTADFKAKVALEALHGDKTIQEIATRYKVHPKLITNTLKSCDESKFKAKDCQK